MDTLFTKTIKAKDRTYFVDVKNSKNNTPYLTVTESKKSKDDDNKFVKSSIMVFKEHASELVAALNDAAAFVH